MYVTRFLNVLRDLYINEKCGFVMKNRKRYQTRVNPERKNYNRGRGTHKRIKEFAIAGLLTLTVISVAFGGYFLFMRHKTPVSDPYGMETESAEVDVTDQILTSASMDHSAWLVNGRIKVAGEPYEGQEKTDTWIGLAQIAVSDDHLVALDHTGFAYAIGNNSSLQCDIDGHRGIVYIESGMNCTIAVLGSGKTKLFGVADEKVRIGLKREKSVRKVDLSDTHVAILRRDGTAAAYGDNKNGACDVSEWKDLIDIRAGHGFSVGLSSDGKVFVTGDNTYGQSDAQNWSDIVAIAAGTNHIVGLHKDGSVVACGKNRQGECDLSEWKEITSIAAGYDHSVGLTESAVPVAAGYNGSGQCDTVDTGEETEA